MCDIDTAGPDNRTGSILSYVYDVFNFLRILCREPLQDFKPEYFELFAAASVSFFG